MPVSSSGKKVLTIEVYSDEFEVKVVNHNREMTAEDGKEIIGWKTEAEGDKPFEDNFVLRDREKNKVQLLNNATNRPYSRTDAERYADAMANGIWELNGETGTIDDKGNLISFQHRIIALILANQAKKGEKAKKVTIPAIIVKGVSSKKEVADTADTGRSRKLTDVVFRNKEFSKKLSVKELKGLAKDYAVATRLTWIRCNGETVSGSGRFEHVEAVAFQKKHPLLKECVNFIFEENGGNSKDDGRKISQFVSLGYAGALMYLMTTCKTNLNKGEISTTQRDKAEKFWTTLASGISSGNDLWSALRKKLQSIDASGAKGRDEICGIIVKAWEIFQAGNADKAITPKELSLKVKVEDGKKKFAESPRFGGLDVQLEEPEAEAAPEAPAEEPAKEAPKKAAKKAAAKKAAPAPKEDKGSPSEAPADSAAAPAVS